VERRTSGTDSDLQLVLHQSQLHSALQSLLAAQQQLQLLDARTRAQQ
jgi:hypothetical protein